MWVEDGWDCMGGVKDGLTLKPGRVVNRYKELKVYPVTSRSCLQHSSEILG